MSADFSELMIQVLVEQEFQVLPTTAIKRRSLSAANSRQALISSSVNSGKSSNLRAKDCQAKARSLHL
jgi:hypothetical protein